MSNWPGARLEPSSARMSAVGCRFKLQRALALDLLPGNLAGAKSETAAVMMVMLARPKRASNASRICALLSTGTNSSHRRRRQRGRSAHQRHLRAAPQCGFGQGISHLSAGAISQEAHRVNRLIGRSGGDQNVLALQVLALPNPRQHALRR